MSNALAIAAVTATLRHLIRHEVPNGNVTTKPLDKARDGASADQLNIFLYQTTLNAAWRNMDMPRQVRPGETGQPPLALNLHYLVTAFGQDDDDTLSHRWLGKAMSVLHDHPLLGAQEIRDALTEDSELQAQIERVRITPQPLSLEDMSKLWTTFQTEYRISAAYQVEVVLIESKRPARTPMPVLARGQDDSGATASAGATVPIIEKVLPPNRQSSALLGDEVSILGQNLGDAIGVRFTLLNPLLPEKSLVLSAPTPLDKNEGIKVTLPNDDAASAEWLAGFYTVAVLASRNGQVWSSNEVPISVAPRVLSLAPPNPVPRNDEDKVTLTVTCRPEIKLASVGNPAVLQFAQRVLLLLDPLNNQQAVSLSVAPAAPTGPAPASMSTKTLQFIFPISDERVDDYRVRLRVDGVDLPLVDWTTRPPTFDASQQVTIS